MKMKSKNILNILARKVFGMTKEEAYARKICIDCKELALPRCYSSRGVREYESSSLCEECINKIIRSYNYAMKRKIDETEILD